jgi:nickel/cobalt transporter (NicO) family protein
VIRRRRALQLTIVVAGLGLSLLGGTPASAHPLGNFSVNHLNQLVFQADRIVDNAIVDFAEIPTAQAQPQIDANGDGSATSAELGAFAAIRCAEFAAAVDIVVDGNSVSTIITSASFHYTPGAAGLQSGRLECRLDAVVSLEAARTVEFRDGFEADRVGWHEINAIGDGARIVDSAVPQVSVTDQLRNYPTDVLASPLDVRTATFDIQPGRGQSTQSADAVTSVSKSEPGPFTGWIDGVTKRFNDLIGRHDLTLGVGLLAVTLALLLGASHALLPGHGKTVMAAYIAGREGTVRDAVLVGATVTGTHTGGVLLLGLALTASSSLAGEDVLGYLGLASGLLVSTVGAGLLISAVRHRGKGASPFGHGHTHRYSLDKGHSHTHGGHIHSHDPSGHTHSHSHEPAPPPVKVLELAGASRSSLVRGAQISIGSTVLDAPAPQPTPLITFEQLDYEHETDPEAGKKLSRIGLIGMGIAGGLVPSPSALVILLSAIALGRTWFGVLLVVGYGAGMAGTLTAAGVLLVKIRDRYEHRFATATGRARRVGMIWRKVMPFATATLVLVVGLGLAARSLGTF